jgi:UDPglucose 6-dehydrogenase
MARISVFGAGYVGLVTAACLAELGNEVAVRDVVREKIDRLNAGDVPIFEPGLDELLEKNRERLRFTLDAAEAVEGAEFIFVCVDTPPLYSGDADLSRVWTVVDELPRVQGNPILVLKSTVPVGTGEKVRTVLDQRSLTHVGYASNPEFTAEGRAIKDFMHPDRVVIGAFDPADAERVAALYQKVDGPIVQMDVPSAEMVKLASNAFLMTRISFINEIANVCEATGADVVKVAEGVGLDHRLGPHFLRAGVGWGGSCLDGRETALVRLAGRTWLTSLAELHELAVEGLPFEMLSWRAEGAEFLPVSAVTRRAYNGDMVEIRTKMGRRLHCTADHPVITREGVKLAAEVTPEDWLPLVLGEAGSDHGQLELDVLAELDGAGIAAGEVIVRAPALAALSAREVRGALPALARGRSYDVLRTGALRLDEADGLDLPLAGATASTVTNGTYVPASIVADERFWRVVGLYIAEGHVSVDGGRHRLQWSFHPTRENDVVLEVAEFWRGLGVKADVVTKPTTTAVVVSSSVLARWWLDVLGLGVNCYVQRIPDFAWSAPAAHRRALLAGMWRGDGAWSFVSGGPSVVLEYGTVSRELADGLLRLLLERGIVARLQVGRTAKSTCDTYWLTISGADQVEQLLDFVRRDDRQRILAATRQTKRIAPTGYRREGDVAWVRVVGTKADRFDGDVYSVEVPMSETFVTTGGMSIHNCFPKDSLALKQLAANSGYHFQLLNAVIEVNELQKRRIIGKLQRHLGKLRGKEVALLGLAFKAGTDDTREAPSLVLASRLIAEGANVRVWDPIVKGAELLPQATVASTVQEAVRGAEAAVIVTEWPELNDLARPEIYDLMARPLIIDGRNLLDPEHARAAGFAYEGIGRPVSPLDVLPETAEREPELER